MIVRDQALQPALRATTSRNFRHTWKLSNSWPQCFSKQSNSRALSLLSHIRKSANDQPFVYSKQAAMNASSEYWRWLVRSYLAWKSLVSFIAMWGEKKICRKEGKEDFTRRTGLQLFLPAGTAVHKALVVWCIAHLGMHCMPTVSNLDDSCCGPLLGELSRRHLLWISTQWKRCLQVSKRSCQTDNALDWPEKLPKKLGNI